jgi:uncharacterized protein YbbC (DUF1343 family)
VTDRQRYNPTRLAVLLLAAVRQVYPKEFQFRNESFDRLAGGPALREALIAGREPWQIWTAWEADLARFRAVRAKYLLY